MKKFKCIAKHATLSGLLTALVLPLAAHAHVTLERGPVEAGSWGKLTLRVPEGCAGSPTTAITVELSDDFYMPRPMPKGGYKLEVKREKLAKPIESHGDVITHVIRSATWSGEPLPDDFYDEFVVFTRMPLAAGKYPVKVSQVCVKGRMDWHDVAKPGQARRELKFPAPELTVIGKPESAAGK